LCPAAVKALSMDILIEVSFAVGWRMKWRRFSVASTIAMLKSRDRLVVEVRRGILRKIYLFLSLEPFSVQLPKQPQLRVN
jgi:hypothetical protein